MIRASGTVRPVTTTACFNVGAMLAAAAGGVVLARALGPTLRGEYAAVTAWFGLVLLAGGLGQQAALCYYVAQYPRLARGYVATSRAMMVATGVLALAGGLVLASVLAHGDASLEAGYRIAFGGAGIDFVGASYTFALQAGACATWNRIRVIQPVLGLVAVCVLWASRQLSLTTALISVVASMAVQFGFAYHSCHRNRLAPGRARLRMVRPLASYGAAQMATLAPLTLNASLDQLVLSQVVSAADLGRYAIAVSITSLPLPVVSAIGFIAFPRLASRRELTGSGQRLLKMAVLVSLAVATAVLVPVCLVATWAVPVVFGASYRGAVGLVWILMPGGIFIACGQVTGDLLRGRRHLSAVAWSQWIAAAATVALLVALLPLAGVAGAAIASSVAYGIALAAMIRALWKAPGGIPADIGKAAAAEPGPRILSPGHRKGAGICA